TTSTTAKNRVLKPESEKPTIVPSSCVSVGSAANRAPGLGRNTSAIWKRTLSPALVFDLTKPLNTSGHCIRESVHFANRGKPAEHRSSIAFKAFADLHGYGNDLEI